MKVSKKILMLLSNDAELRMKVALSLGISEQGVKRNITRNSSTLTKIAAIRVIAEATGYTEDQILAPEKKTA